jgi:hypothetical protein
VSRRGRRTGTDDATAAWLAQHHQLETRSKAALKDRELALQALKAGGELDREVGAQIPYPSCSGLPSSFRFIVFSCFD